MGSNFSQPTNSQKHMKVTMTKQKLNDINNCVTHYYTCHREKRETLHENKSRAAVRASFKIKRSLCPDVSEILTWAFEYFMISKKKDLNRKCVRILIKQTEPNGKLCVLFFSVYILFYSLLCSRSRNFAEIYVKWRLCSI